LTAISRLGISLWGMQSTATRPVNIPSLYRQYAADAQVLDDLGFHSMWSAEHRLWYDGWCPALFHAAAFAASRTTNLRFGTAMALLPQHDATAFARAVTTLDRLTGGRVDLGVALGHRDTEYDALGLRRDHRGRLMEDALGVLADVWNGDYGDMPPIQQPGPPIWVGGLAPAAISRAARFGHGLLLPETLRPAEIAEVCARYRAEAEHPGPIGVTRLVRIEEDAAATDAFSDALVRHFTEEIGAWWVLGDAPGFVRPERLAKQLARVRGVASIGSAEDVAAGIQAAFDAGVDLVVVRLNYDFTEPDDFRRQAVLLAEDVAPLLDPVAAAS
jgi:alkanesulfonate monooxygenase SsuD/methylene tetrahydromethanopterin reductase-like flavin-dependent oxidoreductase (luciferase family)